MKRIKPIPQIFSRASITPYFVPNNMDMVNNIVFFWELCSPNTGTTQQIAQSPNFVGGAFK